MMFLPARRMLQYTPGNATDKNVCQVRLVLACLVWQRNRTGLDRVGGRSRGGGGGGFKERSRRRKCRWGGSTGSDFDHVHRNTLGTLASGTTLTPTTSTWELTRWV